MSSIGTGYDLSASQFSPDGRVFQVEYAGKAVENSGTVVALRSKEGVVFAVEKLISSKLYEQGSNKRIFHIDKHIGMAVAGLISDARQIVETARKEAANYQSLYGVPIPLRYLQRRIASYMHAYTLYSAVRPYGCSVAICSFDKDDGAELYVIEPSGVSHSYLGAAIGKAQQSAKTEIEKLEKEIPNYTADQLVENATKIIYQIHDELKDKNFELEMSWISMRDPVHKSVPRDIIESAERKAKATLQNDSESDGEHDEAEEAATPTPEEATGEEGA